MSYVFLLPCITPQVVDFPPIEVSEQIRPQQSGHYTQYKEAKNQAGVDAITRARRAILWMPFKAVLSSLLSWQAKQRNDLEHEIFSLDYRECLQKVENAVVYADPLHAAVDYSRSYHAIETLVRYDYPELKRIKDSVAKGRYRSDLLRSPFCNKSQIEGAFFDLFDGVKNSKSDLLLSYSKTALIDLDKVISIAKSSLGETYDVTVDKIDYSLLRSGHRGLKKEDLDWLIIAKKI